MQIKRGDVIVVDLPQVGGSVQSGRHHCIVVQNNTGNHFSPTVVVVPCTTKAKNKIPTHLDIKLKNGIWNTALCEQIITISKDCILSKFQTLDKCVIQQVETKLLISLGVAI